MARRRRLTGPRDGFLGESAEQGSLPTPGLESRPFPLAGAPPIAAVSREAAASAALSDLSHSLAEARRTGRMVLALPLAEVEAAYLVRDRIAVPDEETRALMGSLRARGQQAPIEVTELAPGRYGLISGWRRLMALRALHAETGADRFATVLALVRQPREAGEAYVAMVEENEIRLGLSHYERARIVAKAVDQGVFDDPTAALRSLFAAAPRAKRSKIKSFLTLVAALDGHLRFPQGVSEKLGLRLVKALDADPGLAGRLQARLAAEAPATAEAEAALLAAALAPPARETAPDPARPPRAPRAIGPGQSCRLTDGVDMAVTEAGEIVLSGPGADAAFRARLLALFGASDN